jgi:DNA-binding NarL/FixJ family response regulator
MMPIRVTIIEDHEDFREGLFYMLQNTEGFQCAGKFSSVEEALRKTPDSDVVLLDIGLPGKSGIDGIPLLRKKLPGAQIVMLTGLDDDMNIFRAILAGANGYLLKKTSPAKLLHAIEDAASGGMPMTPFVAKKAIEMFRKYVPERNESANLTVREREILSLLVDGMNYSGIAETLFISLDTVRNHIRHIYEKLRVHSKSQAVAKALKQGLI